MSNFLAVATATAALRRLLYEAVTESRPGAVSGADVTTVRPDGQGSTIPDKGVNVYLYQVTPNPALRNIDLPTRRADGSVVQRPVAAVDLHYLLTFHGDEGRLEPQRLLGTVVTALHSRPLLTRPLIEQTIADPSYSFLTASNLGQQVELVKFTPTHLSLEELSKLWSVFFQTPYTLSVAYQGTVVLLESEDTPRPSLPVLARNIYVTTFRQPLVDEVVSAAGSQEPITAASTLVIRGRLLRGDVTSVRVSGVEVAPALADTTPTEIRVAVPAGVRAGVQALQVVHSLEMGTPPTPHAGTTSNVASFVLRPTVVDVEALDVDDTGGGTRSADVRVEVSPPLFEGQRVTLLLHQLDPAVGSAPATYAFAAPPVDPPGADPSVATVMFPVEGVRAAEYLVRVQVDGAESPLELETDEASPRFGRYVRPSVTIP